MDYRQVLQKIIYRIEYNLRDDISLAQLSEHAHLSMYHFSRLFMIYTGLSPMEYTRRRRMLHAAEEIRSGEEILPVALRYGYSSHSGFSKAFKKMFGYPPSLSREENSPGIPPCINLYTRESKNRGKILKSCETERLLIRNFRPDDWKQVQALAIDKETSDGAKYDLTWPTSDEESLKMTDFLSGTDFFWAVFLKENEELIGLIAFNSINENRTLDLGHVFHTKYMGEQEAMTEAFRRMVQYAFDELEIDRIITHNATDWKGQIEPLYRIGMKKTGEIGNKSQLNPDEPPLEFDTDDLGISREEWEKIRK